MKGFVWIAIAALAAAVAASASATSGGAAGYDVTQHSIAGVRLGMSMAQVRAALGAPTSTQRGTYDDPGQPDDLIRVVSAQRNVATYFRDGRDAAIIVTTWNRAYRTAAGIGPCSSIARAKAAYRTTMRPSGLNTIAGHSYGYVLGKSLLLAADGPPPTPSPTVTAIALFEGTAPGTDRKGGTLGYAGFVGISEQNCATG